MLNTCFGCSSPLLLGLRCDQVRAWLNTPSSLTILIGSYLRNKKCSRNVTKYRNKLTLKFVSFLLKSFYQVTGRFLFFCKFNMLVILLLLKTICLKRQLLRFKIFIWQNVLYLSPSCRRGDHNTEKDLRNIPSISEQILHYYSCVGLKILVVLALMYSVHLNNLKKKNPQNKTLL